MLSITRFTPPMPFMELVMERRKYSCDSVPLRVTVPELTVTASLLPEPPTR